MSEPLPNGNATLLAAPLEKREVPRDKLLMGSISLVLWILLFAAGLLIETVEYRLVLAPRSVAKQLGEAEMLTVPGQSAATVRENANDRKAEAQKPPSDPSVTPRHDLSKKTWSAIFAEFQAFFVSIFCFTPINLALLALVAGLLGGCASNIAIETMPPRQRAELRRAHPRRHWYLQEPPVSAAIRGFIVYLCVIGGLYVALDDPFKDPTPAQYIRLAGMLSILAFMVGYDSSRLEDWISIIPAPGQRRPQPAGPNVPLPEPVVNSRLKLSPPRRRKEVSPLPATVQEAARRETAALERLDSASQPSN